MITSEDLPLLDFWFYKVGVNVCPADTRNKKTTESWKPKQDTPMTPEEYEELKNTGAFIRGAAVITGRVWRGNYVGYFLNGIDLDNLKAINEICNSLNNDKNDGKTLSLEQLAENTLLERHPDDRTKLHLYVYSKHPFKNKPSDSGRAWFNRDNMPAIEVKGIKSLMFCTPSMHKNGRKYQFVKQRVPGVSENLEQVINDILSKYDIDYLSKDDQKFRDVRRKNDDKKVVNEGSRHVELLREMNAKLHEFIRTKPLEDIKQMCIKYNNLYCRPPLENTEFERMWNDAVIHVAEKEQERDTAGGNTGNQSIDLISVAEAIRRSSGKVAVKGMIIGLSSVIQVVKQTEFACSSCGYSDSIKHNPPLFSLPYNLSQDKKSRRCNSCMEADSYGPKFHQNKPAMIIQLQDEEKQNDLESLNVVLFDKDTVNVKNGEKAMIVGELHVVQQRGNSNRVTYLFAESEGVGGGIEYERPQNEKVELTEEDLTKLDEFASQQSDDMMTKSLVDMVDPTVIGHEDEKLGIILMSVGAPETEDFRGRIHGLFAGPPGLGKSKLAQAAKRLGQPQSRYSSTQGASGKSITAIIDKDNDSYVLRLGVLPQAKNSICILNEIAALSMEDQRHLFDVMEEGKFTLDKHGFHKEIDSPTTVLGTTNPEGGKWYAEMVDKNQIPLRKELVDRYDLIFVFQSLKDKEQKMGYAKKKLALIKKDKEDFKENHTFLRKVIEHARTFKPELSEEAEAMITDYWSELDTKIFPTNRVLDTIVRVSMAFARIHFSNVVTAQIAKEAISFLTRMYKAFDSTVVVVQDPRDVTCQEIIKFLMQNPNMLYDFHDCINYAASNNTLVEAYMGKSPVDNNSSKYRDIADRFKQGLIGEGLISIESMHPLRLVYKKTIKDELS